MQGKGLPRRPLAFAANGSSSLLHASTNTPWAGVPFELHQTAPLETADCGPIEGEQALVVLLTGSLDISTVQGGRTQTLHALPGSTFFLSWDERQALRMTGSAEVAAVPLSRDWLQRVDIPHAPAHFGRTPPLLADKTAHDLVTIMRRELLSGAPRERLYAESLSLAFLSYVLGHLPKAAKRRRGEPLAGHECRQLAQYVRERLGDTLSVDELASVVGLSAYRFSKLFRDAFGTTPHRYVLEQRLQEGARRLAKGRQGIAEIALSLGFSSQSHFTTAFRQQFQQTPRDYARSQRRIYTSGA